MSHEGDDCKAEAAFHDLCKVLSGVPIACAYDALANAVAMAVVSECDASGQGIEFARQRLLAVTSAAGVTLGINMAARGHVEGASAPTVQ